MIADTLSDAVQSIDQYIEADMYPPDMLTAIRYVRGEMDALRALLDATSLGEVASFAPKG